MINVQEKQDVITSGLTKKAGYSISTDAVKHVIKVIRDDLYSNKVYAVIRELCTNANDAHIEAGQSKPFEVWLPNSNSPIFKVRDFGKGLNYEDFIKFYTGIGESSKRDKAEQTGYLGFGCKSPFAYTDMFTVISYHGGKKSTYSCYIDENDDSQIGLQSEENLEEETGLEIIVPVNNIADQNNFVNEAKKYFSYFNPLPVVKGVADFEPNKIEKIIEGDNWFFTNTSVGSAKAVMGNVPYPIRHENIKNLSPNLVNILKAGVVINFPLGAIKFTPSREELQYTENTQLAIINELNKIEPLVKQYLQDKFKDCKTRLEGICLRNHLSANGGHFISSILNSIDIKVNGFSANNLIDFSIKDPTTGNNIGYDVNDTNQSHCPTLKEYRTYSYRKHKMDVYSMYHFRLTSDGSDEFFIADSPVIAARLKYYSTVNDKFRFYVFGFSTDADRDAFLKKHGFELHEFKLISSLPKAPVSPSAPATRGPKNVKHSKHVFMHLEGQNDDPASNSWVPYDNISKNKNNIYVLMERFLPKVDGTYDLKNLVNVEKLLKFLKHDLTKFPILGVKANHQEKIGKNWIKMEDYLLEMIKKRRDEFYCMIVDYESLYDTDYSKQDPRLFLEALSNEFKTYKLLDKDISDRISKVAANQEFIYFLKHGYFSSKLSTIYDGIPVPTIQKFDKYKLYDKLIEEAPMLSLVKINAVRDLADLEKIAEYIKQQQRKNKQKEVCQK